MVIVASATTTTHIPSMNEMLKYKIINSKYYNTKYIRTD